MPEAWKEELGPDWAQVWHTWRDTPGNLTCTAYNSEMGNSSFREKRDAGRGFRDSPLRLNADLRQVERWDGDSIRARAARLADVAVEIWRRPVLPDRVLASYKAPNTDSAGYTIEHHPHLRPGAPMHDLFEAVRQAILALGPHVREDVRRHYVAYKTQTNFVDVVPQKRRLLLTLNMRFDDLDDPRGLAADITNLGLWGNGDVQVELDNERQIAYAMELVRQAYAGKQPAGDQGGGVGSAPASRPMFRSPLQNMCGFQLSLTVSMMRLARRGAHPRQQVSRRAPAGARTVPRRRSAGHRGRQVAIGSRAPVARDPVALADGREPGGQVGTCGTPKWEGRMKYVRMYTDNAGETHFEDVEVATAPQAFAPPTEPVQVSDPAPAARILFVRIPRGWFGDWHATPKRQFNTTIEGELEITMSDGESRIFGAGAVRLMEDTTGKGHQTRVVGDADVVSMITQTE